MMLGLVTERMQGILRNQSTTDLQNGHPFRNPTLDELSTIKAYSLKMAC